MVTFLFWFAVVWILAGAISMPLSWMTRLIMHSPMKVTEDVIKDENGNKVNVDYGYKAYLESVLYGLVAFWITCGSLAASLYEYRNGTNYPKRHLLNFWNGDLFWFNVLGPLMLSVHGPFAAIKFLRSSVR
ncbi:MAG: hypothetical protein HY225_00335 [Candidatus Vogelbacteria bacterium]|nr:hypothetical protein [Candidatus Vogelbacteria bacterium]